MSHHQRNAEYTCKRCGSPTVFKSGVCRYCQTDAEKSRKASERGNPSTLPGLRPVGTIPGNATEIQYLRNGRVAYYHPFVQPGGGRVKMIALSNGGVMLKGPYRIHADDREPGFDRYTRRRPTMRGRENPFGMGLTDLLVLGGLWWFLFRSPGPGQPTLFSTWFGAPLASAVTPSAGGSLAIMTPGGSFSIGASVPVTGG